MRGRTGTGRWRWTQAAALGALRLPTVGLLIGAAALVSSGPPARAEGRPGFERAHRVEAPAPRIWFHDSHGRLGALDLADGAVTDFGPLGEVLTDIAFAPDGRLFGLSFDSLYEIDPYRRELRRIGRHGVPCGNALEITPDGTAYAMGCSTGGLFQLDLDSGKGRRLAMLPYPSSGDLAYYEGGLLLSARGFSEGDFLVAIDLERLSAAVVGVMGQDQVYGLAADRASGVYAGAGRRYFRIDARTGAAREMGRIASSRFSGVFGWAIEPAREAPLS